MSPIRPENRGRYPENWQEIREAILARAGRRCEGCNKPDGAMVWVYPARGLQEAWSLVDEGPGGRGWWWGNQGEPRPDVRAKVAANPWNWGLGTQDLPEDFRAVRVVLTIAHLDHQPENNDPENLRAWCQRCHNAHDLPERRRNARARAAREAGQGGLF